jgi:hypothetical protein
LTLAAIENPIEVTQNGSAVSFYVSGDSESRTEGIDICLVSNNEEFPVEVLWFTPEVRVYPQNDFATLS